MKNIKYKKMLYLLGLSSMLSLTACNKNSEEVISAETKQECLENHLDKNQLQMHTLSDGSQYIKDADVFASIREQFLKNNRILNCENINTENEYFNQLINDTEYMYMFENSEIRKVIIWTIEQLQKIYPDNNPADIMLSEGCYRDSNTFGEIDLYIPIQVNNEMYTFSFTSEPAVQECVDIEIENQNIIFSKFMRIMNHSKRYDVIQSYSLSSIEKIELDKINVSLSSNYHLNNDLMTEGIYSCEDFSGKLTLNNDEDKIEVEVSEDEFNQLAAILTEAAKQNKTVKEFLQENEELMIELYGEDYERFIEITQSFTYVKKPV